MVIGMTKDNSVSVVVEQTGGSSNIGDAESVIGLSDWRVVVNGGEINPVISPKGTVGNGSGSTEGWHVPTPNISC